MSKELKDDFGNELVKGDIVYIGRGMNSYSAAHIAVIRGIEKSIHTVRLGKRWAYSEAEEVELEEDHIHFGARSLLKLRPEQFPIFANDAKNRAVLNARARVLDGEFDKKKKKDAKE